MSRISISASTLLLLAFCSSVSAQDKKTSTEPLKKVGETVEKKNASEKQPSKEDRKKFEDMMRKRQQAKKQKVEEMTLKEASHYISLCTGINMGTMMKENELFQEEVFLEGYTKAVKGEFTRKDVDPMKLRQAQSLVLRAQKKQSQVKMGDKYLEVNKKKKGVKVLASGLQYRILKEGKGPKPMPGGKVKVHYVGKLITGEIFDSSVKRGKPAELDLKRVIKGWQEALPLMSAGSKYELVIPQNLAYGAKPSRRSKIPPYATLIFEVELLEVL